MVELTALAKLPEALKTTPGLGPGLDFDLDQDLGLDLV